MSSLSLLNVDLQRRYFASCLRHLPDGYSSLDTNRLTLVHFCCHALELLGAWDLSTDSNDNESSSSASSLLLPRQTVIDWIYSLQVEGGFIGGHFLGENDNNDQNHNDDEDECDYRKSHIAMTYTALTVLKLLGGSCFDDDVDDSTTTATTRLWKKDSIVEYLKQLQLPNGSFQSTLGGSEHDMRFLYCACCISHMLGDWRGVNVDAALDYIRSCRSWDGAFGLLPGQEGHGGSTFCAVASLVLMDRMDEVLDQDNWRNELIHWCVSRQVVGLQGRPNKDEDTCYSYWIGGTLRLLGKDDLLDHDQLRSFVFKCQNAKMGGFSKVIGVFPDLLHSYYSLAYLSLSQKHDQMENNKDDDVNDSSSLSLALLKELNCTLGISMDTAKLFEPLHP